MGVEKLNFCQSFDWAFVLNNDLLWMLAPCDINNMYLGKIFLCLSII